MYLKKDKIDTVAIGAFDGLHRGHQELIKKLGENGALVIINRYDANLTPKSKRCKYSKYPCFFYKFEDIKNLSGKDFLTLLQKDFKNLKKIVVGYDFTFGKGKSHGANDLKIMFNGKVDVIKEFFYNGISVHSTIIRQKLKDGNIKEANNLLGREYTITGKVLKGQGLGKKKVYATLNLDVENFTIPKNGVYVTRTFIKNKCYDSISFVGIRHSTDGKFAIETHILDTDKVEDIDQAELSFVAHLRENKQFDSLDKLKNQIAKDITKAKDLLQTYRADF